MRALIVFVVTLIYTAMYDVRSSHIVSIRTELKSRLI